MVRHLRPGGLTRSLLDWLAALWRALLRWFARMGTSLRAARRALKITLWPQDPNNLFVDAAPDSTGSALHMPGRGRAVNLEGLASDAGSTGGVLVYAANSETMLRFSQFAGRGVDYRRITTGTEAANRQRAHWDTMRKEIKSLRDEDMGALADLIERLSRRWLDARQEFTLVSRRTRLDVHGTLKHNIPRYGGRVLEFRWPVKERLVYQWSEPARLVCIGDVSRSMSLYCSVVLYFFHLLSRRFPVESYIFSEKPTNSTPIFAGKGNFQEKLRRLAGEAASWDRGTRFGSSLGEILAEAHLDRRTFAIIATDGKVVLHHGEYEQLEKNLKELRARVHKVIFVTPSLDLAKSHEMAPQMTPVGSFQVGLTEIPIYNLSDLWYSTFARYADQIFYCRTVADLCSMVEFLISEAKAFSFGSRLQG